MSDRAVVYTMTHCYFCIVAKEILRKKGVEFEEVNLDEHPELWDECEKRSGRQTVPQIFIGDRHVGGCDDLDAMNRSGELDKLLKEVKG